MDRLRRRIISSFSSFHQNLLTFAFGLHRFFHSGVQQQGCVDRNPEVSHFRGQQ